MKDRLQKLIVLAAMTALLIATGLQGQTTDKGTIYYLAPTLFDEFQTESMHSIEATFASLGYEVKTLDAQNRSEVQLNQFDDIML